MKRLLLVISVLITVNSHALISINVYKKNINKLSVALVNLTNDNSGITKVIADNLRNSGRFDPHLIQDINTKDKKFEAVIYGDIVKIGNTFQLSIFLKDIWTDTILFAKKINTKKLSRKLAHHISDKIYFTLLGERSVFETNIAYVEVDDNDRAKYKLIINDSDGQNRRVIFSSPYPILSPRFSPDNNYIAYTAFSKNRSNVYVQNLYDKDALYTLPNFNGIASSPAWHPSGKSLLITLSKNGNQDIYLYDLTTSELTRITKHKSIDTEASFSPDGTTIIWTSNRLGNPQIWQKKDNKISKLAISGNYNTSASFANDGTKIVLTHRDFGSYKTAVYNIVDNDLTLVSNNQNDESPRFAPNSKAIIFSDGNDKLNIAAINNSYVFKFDNNNKKIIEPTWSNF